MNTEERWTNENSRMKGGEMEVEIEVKDDLSSHISVCQRYQDNERVKLGGEKQVEAQGQELGY